MPIGAAVILEPASARDIKRLHQFVPTDRTFTSQRHQSTGFIPMGMDALEQIDDRLRRHRHTLKVIKPNQMTSPTNVHFQRGIDVRTKHRRRHQILATRAAERHVVRSTRYRARRSPPRPLLHLRRTSPPIRRRHQSSRHW